MIIMCHLRFKLVKTFALSMVLENILMLGKIEGRKRRGYQRMRWMDGITDSIDMGLGELWELVRTGRPDVLQFMGFKESDTTE